MVSRLLSGLARRLPLADRIQRVKQHDDIQRQTIADGGHYDDLGDDHDCDADPHWQPVCQPEADPHGDDVEDRVQNAVAVVIQRYCHLAVAVDDGVGVFQNFPRGFDHGGDGEAPAYVDPPRNQPEQKVEDEPVQQVRGRVPVRDVLRVLGTHRLQMQQLDIAAFAHGNTAHPQQDEGRGDKDAEGDPVGKVTLAHEAHGITQAVGV